MRLIRLRLALQVILICIVHSIVQRWTLSVPIVTIHARLQEH